MTIKISHLPDQLTVDEDITLEVKTKENYDEFVEIASSNKEHLAAWLPWAKAIPDDGSLTHYEQAAKRKSNNETVDWNIYYSSKLAGAVGLMNRDADANILEIGYWLARDYVGKGIMTRTVAKVIDIAFTLTDTPEIEIAFDEANSASKKVAVTNSLEFKSRREKEPEAFSESGVHIVYTLTREKWKDPSLRSG